jgi:hypothetical protein
VRSVFRKNANRNFTIAQLLLLTAVLFSIFLPQSGFTFDGVKQIELAVKNPGQTGPNSSALWVTNLAVDNTKLTVGVRPFDSTVGQERLHASEVIAGGKTLRLDDSLPATFRGSDTLFIRSQEEVATLVAPVDFPIHSSEFYSPALRREAGMRSAAPTWVIELAAIGKTGNNVFNAEGLGYAPAVKGQTDFDKRYAFGVGVALRKGNSSAEFKLIGRAGQTIKSLVLSSSTAVYWQAPLGEFISGSGDYPSRIEMKVLTGTAQGFLSIKDMESGEFTPLPIAPFAGAGSLQGEAADREEDSSLSDQSGVGGPMLGEESSLAVQSGSGGYAYFTNGVYDSRTTQYKYHVYGAPPNVCGTLRILRNGNWEETGSWMCTNASGYGEKGPWYGSTNQTGQGINILWPNGTNTVGGDYKVDDGSDPEIDPNQDGGVGVPIPTQFNGTASDVQWGTGFKFGSGGWSEITATFRNVTQSKYYDGQGYNSNSQVNFYPSVSPPAGGFSITWGVTPPPQNVHNSTDQYEWCVRTKDRFYPCFACIYFHGPR